MSRTQFAAAMLVAVTAFAAGQAVRVAPHSGATDVWGASFDPSHKITFTGKVTGIEVVTPSNASDSEVTLLVKNRQGGGTAVVDLGPSWFVNHQVAKIKAGDTVQVTGSKAMVDGHGIILSSMIVLRGKGGPVLALRRPGGRAYWLGTEVASNTQIPTGPNVIDGTISEMRTYTQNNVTYQAAVLQSPAGTTFVDLGPQWYYGWQNVSYQIGNHVNVVIGPNPVTVTNTNIYPAYSVYSGNSIYTIRNADGSPVYSWGQ